MRNIERFAKENGYNYTMETNSWGERKITLIINGMTWTIRDRESTSYFSIHGWAGNADKYAVARWDNETHGREETFMTQKTIIEYIVNTEHYKRMRA